MTDRLPDHEALAAMLPKRREPSPADWETARATFAEYAADKGERWHADHGANALHQFAMLAMIARQESSLVEIARAA